MYTNIKASELPVNHGVYLLDLVDNIRYIEERIFSPKEKPYCEIILLNEFPGSTMSGSHIAELVTYATKMPMIYPTSVVMLNAKQECYIIWSTNVSRMLEYMLGRFCGIGDKALKEIWFMIAVALARSRALFHDEWFKGIQLRTKKSIIRHRKFLSDGNDEVGSLRKLLQEFDAYMRTSFSPKDITMHIDVYWTLRLIIRSLEQDRPLEEALQFIVQD